MVESFGCLIIFYIGLKCHFNYFVLYIYIYIYGVLCCLNTKKKESFICVMSMTNITGVFDIYFLITFVLFVY